MLSACDAYSTHTSPCGDICLPLYAPHLPSATIAEYTITILRLNYGGLRIRIPYDHSVQSQYPSQHALVCVRQTLRLNRTVINFNAMLWFQNSSACQLVMHRQCGWRDVHIASLIGLIEISLID